jgi:hypothetical protein
MQGFVLRDFVPPLSLPPTSAFMIQSLNSIFGRKPVHKSGPTFTEPRGAAAPTHLAPGDRKPTFSKVFRWRLPDGITKPPERVEVVGSFTHWQRVQLIRDGVLDAWHATLHHIPGNRTHHYMILVDGQPTHDKNSDGMAVPNGPQEERYAIATDRGPRVFMLFAMTK